MPPRVHNVLSYTLALAIFAGVFAARALHLTTPPALPALLALGMWSLHFARRAAESAWLHRYGKASVPPGDFVVEYVYYWGFAVWNALSVSSPLYSGPGLGFVAVGVVVFVVAELGNARAHRMLRDLRPAGTKLRVIPRGFLFERVSCPHYLFEILTWVGFALVAGTWAARAFLLVGAGILGSWAHARHAAYRKDFDGRDGRELYPPARRALIPGVF